MKEESRQVTLKDLVDLAIAAIPLVIFIGIQYRDELKGIKMMLERKLWPARESEVNALRQVQKEISLMEHGEMGLDAD